MSLGSPNAAMSSGLISVSNIAPNDAYSASVNPPAGFPVSATTIAFELTAATRPVRLIGEAHDIVACALRVTNDPTVGFDGIALKDAPRRSRWCMLCRATGMRGVK